jgi:hypothetical protein
MNLGVFSCGRFYRHFVAHIFTSMWLSFLTAIYLGYRNQANFKFLSLKANVKRVIASSLRTERNSYYEHILVPTSLRFTVY